MTSDTMTVTVQAADLRQILTHTAPFMGKDDTLPMLNAVRLFVDGAELVAEATDRFTLGQSRAKVEGSAPDLFVALIKASDVPRILALAKSTRGMLPHRPITLTVVDNLLTVDDDWGNFGSLRMALQDGDYPKLGALLESCRRKHEGNHAKRPAVLGLDPNHFVKLAKALGPKSKHVTLELSDGLSGIVVTASGHDGFTALLMPRKVLS